MKATDSSIKAAAAKAADRIHNGVDAAEDRVDQTVDAASARAEALEEQLRDVGDRLVAYAKEINQLANKQVRAHPVAAFGVAFVAGIAVARLLRR